MTVIDWIIFNNLVNQSSNEPIEVNSPLIETILNWIAFCLVGTVVIGLLVGGIALIYGLITTAIAWYKDKKNKK